MCSCARGGSSARIPLDTEHLQMLKYLILMIHGGRMRTGEEELIKVSGKKGRIEEMCCVYWIMSAAFVCCVDFLMQIALKGKTWMNVEARSWRVRLVPAGSSWFYQLGSVQYYKWIISALFTICLRKISNLRRSWGKIKDASVCIQWILSLSVLFHSMFSLAENRGWKSDSVSLLLSHPSVSPGGRCVAIFWSTLLSRVL